MILFCLPLISANGKEGKPVILRGQVVNSEARPVAGAEIVAYEKCRDYFRGAEYAKMLTSVQRTDSDGKFYMNVMPTSQYDTYVVVRKEGFALSWDALSYNHDYKVEGNFHIVLEKPNTLAGKIVDAEGAPVAEATVQVLPKTSYLHRLRQRPVYGPENWFTVKTSSNGNFVFKNLPADASADFWVTVAGCDLVYHYTPQVMNGIGFEVGKEDLELVFPQGMTIQGKVLDKGTRRGISGIRLLLHVQDPRNELQQRYRNYELVSGPDGVFSIKGVPAGKHVLRVVIPSDRTAEWIAHPVILNVTESENLKNVIVEVEKGAMLNVLVREKATGRPLSGIQTWTQSKNPIRTKGDLAFFRSLFTSADGFARIRVLPGQYTVNAYDNDYVRLQGGAQAIARASKPSRLSIMLEPKQVMRGTVVEESGRPASSKIVSIYPFGHTVFTDSYGRFEAKPNSQHPTKFLGVHDMERNLAGLTKVGNQSSTARLELKPALSITGLITDTNGAGIPAARVRLTARISNCICFMDEVIANSEGRYRIDAIVPEQAGIGYRLSVNAAGYGPVEHHRISVKGSPTVPVDIPPIKLVPADVSISGIVVDKDGNPAANVPIFIQGYRRFDQPERSVSTDSQGRFVVNRICKGPLSLQASFSSSPGGMGNLYAQGGDKDVRIVLGQKLVHTGDTSLVGKSLPEISGFEFEPMIEKTDNTRLLICFFHFDQQPSKHCVRQLKIKARQLREQGVYVVCVQASRLPKKVLSDFRRKEHISFPIGIVGEDSIKTRQKWAARSLPWLILTDRNHIVTAEGFSLAELSEKIKEAGNAKQ
jgi:protocatechuate 3,4-dioxygenase beta subunit